ncbi:UNVERIFIED_CONTAM: hypothetical protein FKN15_027909 [Acipenser sinensis]
MHKSTFYDHNIAFHFEFADLLSLIKTNLGGPENIKSVLEPLCIKEEVSLRDCSEIPSEVPKQVSVQCDDDSLQQGLFGNRCNIPALKSANTQEEVPEFESVQIKEESPEFDTVRISWEVSEESHFNVRKENTASGSEQCNALLFDQYQRDTAVKKTLGLLLWPDCLPNGMEYTLSDQDSAVSVGALSQQQLYRQTLQKTGRYEEYKMKQARRNAAWRKREKTAEQKERERELGRIRTRRYRERLRATIGYMKNRNGNGLDSFGFEEKILLSK